MSSRKIQDSYVSCGCKAVLSPKDPRASIWKYSLGSLEFPLQNPISHRGKAQGEKPARFLQGDWRALSEVQKSRMFEKLKKKFNINIQFFLSQIKALGYMPIKDENITVVICGLHERCLQ